MTEFKSRAVTGTVRSATSNLLLSTKVYSGWANRGASPIDTEKCDGSLVPLANDMELKLPSLFPLLACTRPLPPPPPDPNDENCCCCAECLWCPPLFQGRNAANVAPKFDDPPPPERRPGEDGMRPPEGSALRPLPPLPPFPLPDKPAAEELLSVWGIPAQPLAIMSTGAGADI